MKMDSRLRDIIRASRNVVFFGGAGVSTESNIPDFRSETGLYRAKQVFGYPPETLLSSGFYHSHDELFFRYIKEQLIIRDAQPNACHMALAELERQGKVRAVITQNIDGLHQKAGSKNVFELHGSLERHYCEKCSTLYDLDYIMDEDNCRQGVPYCNQCGGRVKPDVVLYGEQLDGPTIEGAVDAISKADTLIIGGTSLVVYPAAGFVNYFGGDNLVLINKTETPFDGKADLVIHDSIGKVMKLD